MPETIEDLGKKVKAKYPDQYNDISDIELGRRVKDKYPAQYGDFSDVAVKKYDSATRGTRLNDRSDGPLQPAGVPQNYGVDDALGNLSSGLHSVATAMTPAIAGPILSNPIASLLKLGLGVGAQKGTEAVGNAVGLPGTGALLGDAAASAVPMGVDAVNNLPMFEGVTRPNYYQGGEQGIYGKVKAGINGMNPKDIIAFLAHPKTKITKTIGKAIIDSILESAGEAAKSGGRGGAPPPLDAAPVARDPGEPSQSYVAPGPRAQQGVGAGPELNAGIRYPPPVEQQLPNRPPDDLYNNPPIQDPQAALKQEIADIMFSGDRGVGAGPELAPGIKSSPVTQPRVTSAAKKVAARSLDSYTNPTNPSDPYSRSPAPMVEAPPRAQGVGAGTMEYESLVNAVSKRLNLPSAEQAGEVPAASVTAGTGSGPALPKDLTSLAEKMLAQREVKASVLAKYFKDAKIPVEEVDRLARESPAELKTHAKNAGYPRGISPESLDVVLRKLRAITK